MNTNVIMAISIAVLVIIMLLFGICYALFDICRTLSCILYVIYKGDEEDGKE